MGRLDIRRWIQVYRTAYTVAQSGDGQYVAVGTETGAAIYNLGGYCLATYPSSSAELPVHRLCASLDFTRLALATRLGKVISLELEMTNARFELRETKLYAADCDIHTLAFSSTEERIAVGHLSSALTMLDLQGSSLWAQQNQGAAALGTTWSVALAPDGEYTAVGSAGSGANWLAVLDTETGALRCKRECDAPVTAVAALADGSGVAALSPDEYDMARLTVYNAALTDVLWEQELEGPATALACDFIEPLIAVGSSYEGIVQMWNAATGAQLASESLHGIVNGLSLVRGSFVAAAIQDGSIALLRYLP